MKLPLRFGIPLLILLWLAGGYIPYGEGKTVMVVLAMVVALWTAFSLPHPGPRERPPPEDDDEEPALEGDFPRLVKRPPPANGSGEPPVNGSGRREA